MIVYDIRNSIGSCLDGMSKEWLQGDGPTYSCIHKWIWRNTFLIRSKLRYILYSTHNTHTTWLLYSERDLIHCKGNLACKRDHLPPFKNRITESTILYKGVTTSLHVAYIVYFYHTYTLPQIPEWSRSVQHHDKDSGLLHLQSRGTNGPELLHKNASHLETNWSLRSRQPHHVHHNKYCTDKHNGNETITCDVIGVWWSTQLYAQSLTAKVLVTWWI